MSKSIFLLATCGVLVFSPATMLFSETQSVEAYEHRRVAEIRIELETNKPGAHLDETQVLDKMKTKVGDPFSQTIFDQDLKSLSQEYDRAIPYITMRNRELFITIKVWQKPVIRAIKWQGNTQVSTSKLQKELGIKPHTQFNRDEFNKAFNKVKTYYIKRGYFEAQLAYSVQPIRESNEIDIIVHVDEGRSGHIGKIDFHNFTGKEESELIDMINTKKYNFFTSWLTGKGKYHEEALGHDKLVIVDFLQNEGYADAKVDIDVKTSPKTGKLVVNITAHKGEIYHIGNVSFSGNELYTDSEVEKALKIKDGAIYSPKMIEETSQAIKDLYGKKGYIEANVQYRLELSPNRPVYNVHYDIEEHEQYKIGLIRVVGNSSTNTNVILRESLLVPGEVFDSRKLKATEQRIESIGYFKSVNVYPVRTPEDRSLGANYRDVIIEVEEQSTGNMSLFFGFSTMNELFGGLELTENNFNIKGLASWWRTGLAGLRGNGEYAHVKLTIGSKEQSYVFSWLTPYLNDTRWRLGFDVGYTNSKLTSKNYDTKKVFGSVNASYPFTSNVTWGVNSRLSNADIDVTNKQNLKPEEVQKQEDNSGLVFGVGTSLGYNSTNSSYKATRGIRSSVSGEIATLRRHSKDPRIVYFAKGELNNTFYYPVWKKGTFKMRADARFIYPLHRNESTDLPVSERFFLGGETTVRGYRTFSLGPKLQRTDGTADPDDPIGGVSSHLFSLEYLQNIWQPIDAFVFFDGGAISGKRLQVGAFRMSYGVGLRLEVMRNVPLMVGYGIPINPEKDASGQAVNVDKFFFAMGAQW